MGYLRWGSKDLGPANTFDMGTHPQLGLCMQEVCIKVEGLQKVLRRGKKYRGSGLGMKAIFSIID